MDGDVIQYTSYSLSPFHVKLCNHQNGWLLNKVEQVVQRDGVVLTTKIMNWMISEVS